MRETEEDIEIDKDNDDEEWRTTRIKMNTIAVIFDYNITTL